VALLDFYSPERSLTAVITKMTMVTVVEAFQALSRPEHKYHPLSISEPALQFDVIGTGQCLQGQRRRELPLAGSQLQMLTLPDSYHQESVQFPDWNDGRNLIAMSIVEFFAVIA
jgi:hypothetical protein